MKKLFTFILLFVVLGLISGCEEVTPEKTIDNAIKQISISEVVEGDVGRVVLPNNKKDVYFEWSSSDEEVITKNGYVTHDLLYDKEVTLTVKATYQGISKIKDFPIIVKNTSADQIIDDLLGEIVLPESVSDDLQLVDKVTYGEVDFEIVWESSNQSLLTNEGKFVATAKGKIDLVAKVTLNNKTYERTFNLEIYPRAVYQINTVEDFAKINDDLDGLYYLNSDLDFTGKEVSMIGSADQPFTGILRGKGHKLSNVNLVVENDVEGLFSVNEGLIEKLAILNFTVNGTISTQGFLGGLVGLNKGLIDQCHLDGKITLNINEESNVSIGGFVGKVEEGKISNSVSSMVIELNLAGEEGTNLNVGGFVGLVTGGTIQQSIYEDSANYRRNATGRSILIKNANDNAIAAAMFVGRIEENDAIFDGSFAVGALEVKDFDQEGTNPQYVDNFAGVSPSFDLYESCFVLDTALLIGRVVYSNCSQMSTSTMVTEDWYLLTLGFDAPLWDFTPIYSYTANVARLAIFNFE